MGEAIQPLGYCRRCEYDLRGLTGTTCPECGGSFDPSNPKTFRRKPRSRVWRWIRRGVYLLVALSLLIGGPLGWLYWGWKQEQPIIERMNQLGGMVQCQPMGPKWVKALMPQNLEWVLDRADATTGWMRKPTDEDLARISTLSRLRKLMLFCPSLTDPGWERLSRMAALEELHLYAPDASNQHLAKLSGLGKLRKLGICSSNATDECFASLRGLSSLEELDLVDVPILGRGLRDLASMSKLRVLKLRHTTVSIKGLSALAGASVEELELEGVEFSDAHLQVLPNLPRLRRLSLVMRGRLTPACIDHLKACAMLREVAVEHPSIRKAITEKLPNVKLTPY